MPREYLRLSRGHRTLFYACFGLLFLTGALWLVFHYGTHIKSDLGDLPHPLESLWLKIHGAAAMVFLIILGALVRGHIQMGWGMRKNRRSGAMLVAANLLLLVTGWALYYVGNEGARVWTSAVHWGLGLFVPVLVVLHVLFGRRTELSRQRFEEGFNGDAGIPWATDAPVPAARRAVRSETLQN